MTKVVSFSMGLIFLLAAASPSRAQQTGAANTAVNQAVLNEANTIVLRQKLAEAQAAVARGDLVAAAKIYEDAYALVQQIGPGIPNETQAAVSGLVSVRLELAREAQTRGDLRETDIQVTRALKVDPTNPVALALKKQNDQALHAMAGKMPDTQTLEIIPVVTKTKTDAATLVQDGKLLYEMGKYEEAETKLEEAIKMDPDNRGAFYYLTLVKQQRFSRSDRAHTLLNDDRIVQVQQAWDKPLPNTSLPTPNPYAMTNLVYTGSGRQAIISKLDRIRLDTFPAQASDTGLPLSEVVRNLSEQIKLRDPDKRGVNFLINPNAQTSSGGAAAGVAGATGAPGATVIDPATGLPVTPSGGGGEPVDINSVLVKINPQLTDVRLADVLDAIVQVADHPITYTIEDYAVVFSAKGPETPQLTSRHFRVDPNTFYQGLESVDSESFGSTSSSGSSSGGSSGGGGGNSQNQTSAVVPIVDAAPGAGQARQSGGQGGGGGGGGGTPQGGGLNFVTRTNSTVDVSVAAQKFFSTLGVNLDPTTPGGAGKSIFFNDRLGELFVRATEQDLDTIENAIEVLNRVSPQVQIKSRFIEIEQDDDKALGFDWYLGNFVNGTVVANGGSAPSLTVPTSAANPLGAFPGNTTASLIPGSANDQLLTSGLRNSLNAPALATVTGILTDPNFRVVLHALEQRSGFETLATPEVVTTSGRQAQMRATTIISVVTGLNFQQGTAATTTTGTTP